MDVRDVVMDLRRRLRGEPDNQLQPTATRFFKRVKRWSEADQADQTLIFTAMDWLAMRVADIEERHPEVITVHWAQQASADIAHTWFLRQMEELYSQTILALKVADRVAIGTWLVDRHLPDWASQVNINSWKITFHPDVVSRELEKACLGDEMELATALGRPAAYGRLHNNTWKGRWLVLHGLNFEGQIPKLDSAFGQLWIQGAMDRRIWKRQLVDTPS